MIISFTDDVPANNTIWILGDSLLTEAVGHYNTLKKKKEAKSTEQQALYMDSMYAIRLVPSGIYTQKQAKNMPSIILNSLVDTLNIKAKVPHTLVIIINDPRFWNDKDLLTFQIERVIQRFIKEICRIVEARNLSLPPRAVNWDYPRIFITRALPLPNHMTKQYPKGFKPNRRKYNRSLQRGEMHYNYTTINLSEFTSENNNKLFAPDGSITHKGFISFWTTISNAIHKADNQDRINLNKAKAKQLGAQISLTTAELKTNEDQDLAMSDIEILSDEDEQSNSTQHKNPTKRALLDDFTKCDNQKFNNGNHHSPASTISEYFTASHQPKCHRPSGIINPKPITSHSQPHASFKRRGQQKFHKNSWKKPQWN